MKIKTCTKCGEDKPLFDFFKDKNRKDGFHPQCKKCVKKQLKEHYELNKEKINNKKKEYNLKNQAEILLRRKKIRENNKEKIALQKQKSRLKNKANRNKYEKIKRQTDINYKLIGNLRTCLSNVLKRNTKSSPTLELLGCSIEQLKIHLESQFTDGMNWNNHTVHGWHIDHIKPCASFDLSKPSEQLLCFNYTNLQPLWAIDNLRKGDK